MGHTRDDEAARIMIDRIRACSADELRLLSHIGHHHAAHLAEMGASNLTEIWMMLGCAADAILAEHPDALTPADRAFLDSLDTPNPGGDDV